MIVKNTKNLLRSSGKALGKSSSDPLIKLHFFLGWVFKSSTLKNKYFKNI